jgi:hypothetical protein
MKSFREGSFELPPRPERDTTGRRDIWIMVACLALAASPALVALLALGWL